MMSAMQLFDDNETSKQLHSMKWYTAHDSLEFCNVTLKLSAMRSHKAASDIQIINHTSRCWLYALLSAQLKASQVFKVLSSKKSALTSASRQHNDVIAYFASVADSGL
eukprot:906-Heterococcus_DN1.PRE.1